MKRYNKKGIALFVVISIMFLLSIGSAVILLTAYNYANLTENQIRRSRAMVLAEAGINYAYWKIRIGEDDTGAPITYPCTLTPPISLPSIAGWVIQVDVDWDPDLPSRLKIDSTVTYPKASVF